MKKKVLMITAGIFATEIMWQLFKRYRRWKISEGHDPNCLVVSSPNELISQALFFTKESAQCRVHANERKPCEKPNCPVAHLNKIVNYIDSAEYTLDVCVYFFTCQELATALVNAQKRGVRIRIILDASMADGEGYQTATFRTACIRVRLKRFNDLMHHKFAIIDSEVLITGSANWTMNAFFGNFDNIIVTNEPSFVKPFAEEFERMWIDFDTEMTQEKMDVIFKTMKTK